MNRFKVRVPILFLSLFVLSFGYAQETTGVATTMDEILTKISSSGLFSGSVLVAQNGNILLSKGYGLANRENNIANTPETVFRIASISKQFTSMGIMMLQAQGKLDVQDVACKYLADCPEEWQPITIHQLLTHTSGLADGTPELVFAPGEQYSYSSEGYNQLGKIIAHVSGQSYEDFMRQMIFEPLGMNHTNFILHQDNEAVGYRSGSPSPVRYEDLTPFNAAGGIYSTIGDLYLWDQALYTEQLLSKDLLEAAFTPYEPAHISLYGGQTGYGYGWIVGQEDTHKAMGHDGWISGFRTILSRYPDDNVTVILLCNQEDSVVGMVASLLAKKVFGEE
jgi:CubicO group peptidase (beta-lactamase class C family)